MRTVRKPLLKPYSVLLLYPDYLSGSEGVETYYAWVKALSNTDAIEQAQIEARSVNTACRVLEDFRPLLVLKGHVYGEPI